MAIGVEEAKSVAERKFVAQPRPAVSRTLDDARTLVFAVALIGASLAFSLKLVSFLHAKEAVLAAGLCALGVLAVVRGRLPVLGLRAWLPLWLLVLVSLTIHPVFGRAHVASYTLEESARATTLLVAAALTYDLTARPRHRERILTGLVLSGLGVAILGLLQYAGLITFLLPVFPAYTQRVYSVFGNQDLFGGFLAVVLPVALARILNRRRFDPVGWIAVPPMIVGLGLSGCRSAWLAAVVGVALALAFSKRRSMRLTAVAAVTLVCLAAVVWMAPEATTHRAGKAFSSEDVGGRARWWFWAGTVEMVRDHPITGVGLGNYAYWSPSYLGKVLHAPGGERYFHNELHVDHAHSEPLEILAECGVVGAVLCLWMLARLMRCRGPEWGGLAALLAFSLFNAALHSAPHALAGLLLGSMLMARKRRRVRGGESRAAAFALPAAAAALAAGFVWTVLLPSYWLRAAEDVHLAGRDPSEPYLRALAHPWPHYTADDKYAIALTQAGKREEAREHFEAALRGLDTGEVYLGLGSLAVEEGDKETARKWLRECLYRWPSYRPAWDLLLWATPEAERERVRDESQRWIKER